MLSSLPPEKTDPKLLALYEEWAKRAVKEDFAAFCAWVNPDEPPAAHHRLMCKALQRLESKEISRLIMTAPPGAAKSSYTSMRFPAWYLSRHPKADVIGASHTAELAERFSRRVRNTMSDPEFETTFGVAVSKESSAATRWETTQQGNYSAVGVGGAVTGRRADLIVMDDLTPSRETADSETYRNKCWEWWLSDMRTRLKPGGAVVMVTTRWHPEDLAGLLLKDQEAGGEKWHVLNLKMECEEGDNDPLGRKPGDLLWPEWFTPEMARIARRDTRGWNALYQQRPTDDQGDYFKREWLRLYDANDLPPLSGLSVYGASDYAVTQAGGDYTVHVVAGVDRNDDMYLLDLWRKQTSPDEWIESLLRLAREYKPVEWAEEAGQIQKSVGPFIDKRQQETKTHFYRRAFSSSSDKSTRAQAIRGRFAQGKVYLPRAALWTPLLVDELMRFPVGSNDDQVDVLSLLGRLLADTRTPRAPVETVPARWKEDRTVKQLIDAQAAKRRAMRADV